MMIALLLRQGIQTCARNISCVTPTFAAAGGWASTITSSCGRDRRVRSGWTRPRTRRSLKRSHSARSAITSSYPGRRTRTIDIITTLLDADEFTQQDIADLYGFRWNAELDIRSIKASLNLAHVRCKSPEMVHRELWTTILAYNLIRTTAAGAALVHGKQPRQISFTSTCQYVLASWMQLSGGSIPVAQLDEYLAR